MVSIKRGIAACGAVCLVLAATSARASTIEVKVPFSFLVHGQMLPAGQYRVTSESSGIVEIVGERGARVAMFAMATPAGGHDPAGEQPALTFKKAETQYRLSSIWASGTDGKTITGQ